MERKVQTRLLPYSMTLVVIAIDQISKALIVTNLAMHEVGFSLFYGFFRIIHEKNLGVALSLGDNFPPFLRFILFVIFPLFVLGYVVFYSFKADSFSVFQRYVIAGIIGGGLGNIIDRVFRADGVIDFISLRMYGLFHMSYFPTFNMADFILTSSTCLLLFSLIMGRNKINKERAGKTIDGYDH